MPSSFSSLRTSPSQQPRAEERGRGRLFIACKWRRRRERRTAGVSRWNSYPRGGRSRANKQEGGRERRGKKTHTLLSLPSTLQRSMCHSLNIFRESEYNALAPPSYNLLLSLLPHNSFMKVITRGGRKSPGQTDSFPLYTSYTHLHVLGVPSLPMIFILYVASPSWYGGAGITN